VDKRFGFCLIEEYNRGIMKKTILLGCFVLFAVLLPASAQAEEWTRQTSGVTNDLNQIHCPTERTCFAVGGAPFIGGSAVFLQTVDAGAHWSRVFVPTIEPLRSVHCTNASLCLVVGDNGTILKTTTGGRSWSVQTAGTAANRPWFWDVWMRDANSAVAVGNAGVIYRTTNGGSTWTSIASGRTNNLHGVHFANASTGWIMGSGGTLLKTINGGLTWLPLTVPNGNLLWTASSLGHRLWVVGDSLRFSENAGLGLTTQTTGVSVTYRGVDFISAENGFLVGASGEAYRTTNGGQLWERESSATSVILRDVTCFVGGLCYAVGDDGTIVRRGAPHELPAVAAPTPQPTPPANPPAANPPPVIPPGQIMITATASTSGPRALLNPQALQAVTRALFSDTLGASLKAKVNNPSKFNAAAKKRRAVEINPSLFAENQVALNFFDNEQLTLNIAKRETRGGKQIIRGSVSTKPTETATFVTKGGSTVGNIHTDKGVYQIRSRGGGAHVIEFIDTRLLPPDTHATPVKRAQPPRVTITVPVISPAETVATIDVIVAYTPQALETLDGDTDAMEALIELTIDETNQIFENTSVGARLSLVGIYYTPRYDVERGGTSGTLDIVTPAANPAALRSVLATPQAESNADIATLLVAEGGNACGSAWQFNEDNTSYFGGDYAMNVVDIDCLANYSYAHEMGHNMGLAHDRVNGDTTPLYTYGYGYQEPEQLFRTIMAYPCDRNAPEGGCPRVPFFSDPGFVLFGRPFGVANQNDETRALQLSRWLVKDFRGTSGSSGVGSGADAALSADTTLQTKSSTGATPKIDDKIAPVLKTAPAPEVKKGESAAQEKVPESVKKKMIRKVVPKPLKKVPDKKSSDKESSAEANESDTTTNQGSAIRSFFDHFFR